MSMGNCVTHSSKQNHGGENNGSLASRGRFWGRNTISFHTMAQAQPLAAPPALGAWNRSRTRPGGCWRLGVPPAMSEPLSYIQTTAKRIASCVEGCFLLFSPS